MHAWDRERTIHNPDLYAIWNAKPWLLDHALRSFSHSDYDFAFWVDAGSFRGPHPFRQWPDPRRIEKIFSSSNKDKVLIPLYGVPGLKEYAWSFETGPVDMDLSEGSFFGSTPSGISWFFRTFYETHDWYINTSPPAERFPPNARPLSPFQSTAHTPCTPFHFVGKDQTLINTMLFRHPDKFIGMLAPSHMRLLPPVSPSSLFSPSIPSTPPPTSPPSTSDEPVISAHILTLSSLLARLTHVFPLIHTKPCGGWYFYEWFLASDGERARAHEAGWARCPRARVEGKVLVDVERMLMGLFGTRWVEGRRAGGA
ncbi:hypothetical protein C0992_000932 [Termitomyces sp. T32_za158]|nr:hypothetical protein C0992_000932 [Termitomyces sp. T32_za158]